MKEYCEYPYCENQSIQEVPVSVEKPSDQVRRFVPLARKLSTRKQRGQSRLIMKRFPDENNVLA